MPFNFYTNSKSCCSNKCILVYELICTRVTFGSRKLAMERIIEYNIVQKLFGDTLFFLYARKFGVRNRASEQTSRRQTLLLPVLLLLLVESGIWSMEHSNGLDGLQHTLRSGWNSLKSTLRICLQVAGSNEFSGSSRC